MNRGRDWYKVYVEEAASAAFRRLTDKERTFLCELRAICAKKEAEKDGKLTGFVGTIPDVALETRRQERAVKSLIQAMAHFLTLRGSELYMNRWADEQGDPLSVRRAQEREKKRRQRAASPGTTEGQPGDSPVCPRVEQTESKSTDNENLQKEKKDPCLVEIAPAPDGFRLGPAVSKFLSMGGEVFTASFYGHIQGRAGTNGARHLEVQAALDEMQITLSGKSDEQLAGIEKGLRYFDGVMNNMDNKSRRDRVLGEIAGNWRASR